MPQVDYANRAAAIAGAISDAGTDELAGLSDINVYGNPVGGPIPDTETTYVVVKNGTRGWVALKSAGDGTWAEV